MRLEGERCVIRDLVAEDAEAMARHANNRKIWLNLRDRFPHPYSIEDGQRMVRRSLQPTCLSA